MNPDPPPHRVSMRDIAKIMGVSHVTVSLALRNSRQISAKLKAEIQQMADQLGYRPDPMLSALSSYQNSKRDPAFQAVIGWINAWPDPDQLRGYEEFDAYWKGANTAAKKLGYRIEEFRMGGDITAHRLDQILTSRGIRGLLLPPHHLKPDWQDFPWEKYFIMKFGRSLHQPATHLATADQLLNTVLAFDKILELGYRRVGFVTKEPHMKVHGHLFEAGFMIAQQSVARAHRLPVLSLVGMDASQAVAPLVDWIKKWRPDAIYTDIRWITTLLKKAKLRVPEDIALAATTILDTGVDSGIDQHPEEIGRVGMMFLHSLINDGAVGIPTILRQTMIQGSWVVGTSMPPLQAKAARPEK